MKDVERRIINNLLTQIAYLEDEKYRLEVDRDQLTWQVKQWKDLATLFFPFSFPPVLAHVPLGKGDEQMERRVKDKLKLSEPATNPTTEPTT